MEEPVDYRFSEGDRAAFRSTFWKCPARLVEGGIWAGLWRPAGTRRGGGAASSLLPVLAVHAFPGQEGAEEGWTAWRYLSRRRMGRLAGLDKDTATAGLRQLVDAGLAETRFRPRAEDKPGYLVDFRLAARLYAGLDERYAAIPAMLFYGGSWCLLPGAASRQLLLVLACLDPVWNEDAFVSAEMLRAPGEREEILARARARFPRRVEELVRLAGLTRSTGYAALQALQEPLSLPGCETARPLVRSGRVPGGLGGWYAPDRAEMVREWLVERLNAIFELKA